jgi:hypothetical protein
MGRGRLNVSSRPNKDGRATYMSLSFESGMAKRPVKHRRRVQTSWIPRIKR